MVNLLNNAVRAVRLTVGAAMILKDKGHGITEQSLDFWHANKHRIGKIEHIVVTAEPLLVEQRTEKGISYPAEYNFIAKGTEGSLYLSGCNCGYGGTGPNGTAKILADLGLPLVAARKAMRAKRIGFILETDTLQLDGKEYEFPLSELRRETMEFEDLLTEVEYERGMEVLEEMKLARRGDDGDEDYYG